MKSSIKRLLLFLTPLLLMWPAIEYFYRTVPNNYTIKREYMDEHSSEVKTLLLGDSHCMYGLNPKYFSDGTFNLSNVSQSLYFDTLLFDKYIGSMPALETVVLCIEYVNLSQKDNTDEDVWRKYYYHGYMGLHVPSVSWSDPKRYSLALVQNARRSAEMVSRYHNTGAIADCDTLGWGTNYNSTAGTDPAANAKQRARQHEDGSLDFSVNMKRIQHIIDVCKKKKVQVLIVSMPHTTAYTSFLNQEKLQKIFASCSYFQQQNTGDVFYLNLFEDARFTDADFYDADHLNHAGSKKCSMIVSNLIEGLNRQ